MESIDGIEVLHMSGARAVLVPAGNRAIERKSLEKAFADQGMELVRYEPETRARGQGLVLVDTGVT